LDFYSTDPSHSLRPQGVNFAHAKLTPSLRANSIQHGIISDQLARAHARRTLAEHGALPSGCDSPLYEGLGA
jgi:hypothetical protein